MAEYLGGWSSKWLRFLSSYVLLVSYFVKVVYIDTPSLPDVKKGSSPHGRYGWCSAEGAGKLALRRYIKALSIKLIAL